MRAVALLLAAVPLVDREPAPHHRQLLVDEAVSVPHGQEHSVEMTLKPVSALLECRFRVTRGPAVRLLVKRARPGSDTLAQTKAGKSGELRLPAPGPGEYLVVVDNRAEAHSNAEVSLQVSLVFRGGDPVRVLSPKRRAVVVALSALFFVAIAAWSGRRLWRAGVFRRS